MNRLLLCGILCITAWTSKAQYTFSGNVNVEQWKETVSLSVIEDYRKMASIYTEQIFCELQPDSLGKFVFSGNELDTTNKIYRLHVDNCSERGKLKHQFDGHCKDSRYILFIGKNTDTTSFPFTFDEQMFCFVKSTNPVADAMVKIDSLREDMKFAYSDFRSEANRKLNDKKWFNTFQDFGKKLNEPLAELYIYSFLSDRSSPHYAYYLADLKTNPYYDDLLHRLNKEYPNSSYALQYAAELASDKYLVNGSTTQTSLFYKAIAVLLALSVLLNVFLFWKIQKQKPSQEIKSSLTQQEQKVLQLLLKEYSNKEIADALFVSLSTVKTHINNIYKKLNVASREEVKKLYLI